SNNRTKPIKKEILSGSGSMSPSRRAMKLSPTKKEWTTAPTRRSLKSSTTRSRRWSASCVASSKNSATKSRPTPNPARRSSAPLSRSAAEQGRSNIGRDHHLLGRLLRRHLLTGHRRSAGWWIDQAAMLNDFHALRAIERLVFEERFRNHFQL